MNRRTELPRRAVRAWLRRLHWWIGLSGGALFALLALGGTVLLFENALLKLAHPELVTNASHVSNPGMVLQRVLAAAGRGTRSVQFPNRDRPVWQATKPDGTHLYLWRAMRSASD